MLPPTLSLWTSRHQTWRPCPATHRFVRVGQTFRLRLFFFFVFVFFFARVSSTSLRRFLRYFWFLSLRNKLGKLVRHRGWKTDSGLGRGASSFSIFLVSLSSSLLLLLLLLSSSLTTAFVRTTAPSGNSQISSRCLDIIFMLLLSTIAATRPYGCRERFFARFQIKLARKLPNHIRFFFFFSLSLVTIIPRSPSYLPSQEEPLSLRRVHSLFSAKIRLNLATFFHSI